MRAVRAQLRRLRGASAARHVDLWATARRPRGTYVVQVPLATQLSGNSPVRAWHLRGVGRFGLRVGSGFLIWLSLGAPHVPRAEMELPTFESCRCRRVFSFTVFPPALEAWVTTRACPEPGVSVGGSLHLLTTLCSCS